MTEVNSGMDLTASSISISFNKDDRAEEMSMSFAAMGDALAQARKFGKKTDDSISNERIRCGEDLLGTYRVISEPIEGGMGSVYRVHHMGWDMDLAMKRPKARFFAEAGSQRKGEFIEECDHWIRLGLHPNIVSCYYVREIGGVPTIFSEWMDGGSLKDRIRDGSLYEGTQEEVSRRILDMAIQAARGLRYSQANGLIHQDVKPGNILLTPDWDVKVADFGIARIWQQQTTSEVACSPEAAGSPPDEQTTPEVAVHPNTPIGYTPQYCPAEQVAGEKPERWMDVYAFALTVLEMYIGKRLWETGADARNGAKAFYEDGRCRVPVPEAVRELLDRCLTEKPDGFADVEAALTKIYREETGSAYPRAEAKSASDTPDSLNNRALSFLDLGQPGESLRLWERALYVAPGHVPSRFNRELYLLRSGDKKDYEAIEALKENSECREEDAAGEILREWDRTGTLIPAAAAFEMENCATSAALSPDHIVFACGDSNAAFSSEKPCIRRVRRDDAGAGGYESDDLSSVRAYRSKVMKIALHPGGEMAALLLESGTLCLYDIPRRRVLRAVHNLPEDYIGNILTNSYYLRCTFSPDGRILAIHNEKHQRETVLVEIPSMRVIAGLPMDFCAFSREGRPLVIGRGRGGLCALFEIDLQGREREVFRFGSQNIPEQYVVKKVTDCPLCPFLSFQLTEYGPDGSREETVFLDEEYQQVYPEENPGEVLFADPEQHLLYSVLSVKIGTAQRELIAVKDSRTLKMLFSVEIGAADPKLVSRRVLCDLERKKILMWETKAGSPGRTGWSREASFPAVSEYSPASYRLSEIVTQKARSREDERLARFLADFRQAAASENYARALAVYREAREITGFHGSAAALEMQDALEEFAERFALRSLHEVEERADLPDLFYIGKQWYRCRDGLIAVYNSEAVSRSDGIHLYKPDGTPVRTIEITPPANGMRVSRERVFAWIGGTFHAAVYDLEGNLIHAGPEGWPPPQDKLSDYRAPHVMDFDRSGRYVLFCMMKLNGVTFTAPDTGIYEMDLDTGHMVKLGDYEPRYDKYKKYGYFDDDTLLIRTGKTLSRFEKGTGRKLMSYRISEPGRAGFQVAMNQERDRFFVTVLDESLRTIGLYAFHKDGKELFHERGKDIDTYTSWFPGNRFAVIYGDQGFRVWDFERGAASYETDSSYLFGSLSPDGQILYVWSGTRNNRRLHVYELEFDYKVKGTPDPGGQFSAAKLVAREQITPEVVCSPEVVCARQEQITSEVVCSPEVVGSPPDEQTTPEVACSPGYPAIEYDETQLTREDMLSAAEDAVVAIPDKIRSIGPECFKNRSALRQVIIPEGVTEICSRAFANCRNLVSVSIPGTVRRIGKEAFCDCTNLREIALPPALKELGASAFRNCESLQSVRIPEGVTELTKTLFSGCKSMETATLPEGLLLIGDGAFENCKGLGELVIPDTVFRIHERALTGCEKLVSVKLPKSLRYIEERLFCTHTALQKIEIPEGVTEIKKEAFRGCSSLASVRFPKSLRKIGKQAFGGCTSLAEISIPDGCTELGELSFDSCGALKSAVLADTIRTIDKKAFCRCGQLETVKFPGALEVIGDNAFEDCTALGAAVFGEGLTQIGHYAFKGCSSLSRLGLPETLIEIGMYAFSGDKLEGTVRIPSSVETIREGAFADNPFLEAFEVSDDNQAFVSFDGVLFKGNELAVCPARKTGKYTVPDWAVVIGSYGFSDCRGLTEIVLPEEALIIRDFAFRNCTGLTCVRIPPKVSKLSGGAFAGCTAIERFEAAEGSPYFKAADGVLMSADGKQLVCFPPARGGEYTVPGSVEWIGAAFACGSAQLKVTVRNGKVNTEWNAFRTDGTLVVDCPKGSALYETLRKRRVPLVENSELKEEKKSAVGGWLKKLFGKK